MPVHRIPRADAEDAYTRITRDGETVNHIVVDGDEYVFFTFLDAVNVTAIGAPQLRYITSGGESVETPA